MKKLFYSFVMLVAMSLTFVACGPQVEPDPEVESNCDFLSAQYSFDETGNAMYVFEFTTNGVDVDNAKGTGEYLAIMLYAQPGEDDFPVAKTYNYSSFEDLANSEEWDECVIGAYAMSQTQLIGTYVYVIENDEATDILLSTDATVKFEGNKTKGTITADIEFESVVTGDIINKQYIYSGAMNLEEIKGAAPARTIKLNK